MTNAEARFNNSLRPRKPEGSLGRTAQDVTSTLTQLLNYERGCTSGGCTSGGVYIPCIYSHTRGCTSGGVYISCIYSHVK